MDKSCVSFVLNRDFIKTIEIILEVIFVKGKVIIESQYVILKSFHLLSSILMSKMFTLKFLTLIQ